MSVSMALGPYRLFVLPGIVVAGVLVSLVLIVRPVTENLSQVSSEVVAQQTKLDFLTSKVNQLHNLDQQLVSRRLGIIEKAVPPDKDAVLGIVAVQSMAAADGLTVDSLSVSPGPVASSSAALGSGKVGLPIQIGLSGSKDSMISFLKRFETPTFPVMIPTRADITQNGDQVSLKLEITMLWQSDPTKFGGDSQPVSTLSVSEENLLTLLEQDYSQSGNKFAPGVTDQGFSGKASLF